MRLPARSSRLRRRARPRKRRKRKTKRNKEMKRRPRIACASCLAANAVLLLCGVNGFAPQSAAAVAAPRFTHPRDISNPYLPLASLKQDILEGREGGKQVRVERTVHPELRKVFKIGDQSVETLAVEDRESENGELAEVTIDYFAQADDGTIYYLGQKVD